MTEVRYGQGVSDVRVSLVSYATQFVGNPYVWGGTSLTRGADCSGFVMSVFANYGISLPHSSRAQANCGTKISASDAQPGDLFFYGNGSSIIMWLFILEAAVWYMQVHRSPVSRSQEHTIEHRSK